LVALIGINCCATLFGVVVVALPLALQRRWVAFVIMLPVAYHVFIGSGRHEGENPLLKNRAAVAQSNQDRSCGRTPEHLGQVLQTHVLANASDAPSPKQLDSDTKQPIYLISAEGGGIRAALWTALNLSQLGVATGGRFGEDVATLSGVSGGSLGIMA